MSIKETFKDIPGLEGKYQASNLGNIKSVKRNCIMKHSRTPRGYCKIPLITEEGRKTFYIHRLVMAAFVGESGLTVNHKDGLKTNNRLDNLEYLTMEDNTKHAVANELTLKGENNFNSKLTEGIVLACRALNKQGVSIRELARRHSVSFPVMRRAIKGISWKHI